MVNFHQLACALTTISLIIPEAGLVPFSCTTASSTTPTAWISQAVEVLDRLGRRLAELEAEVAYFGICLRKRFVDPAAFKHLSASGGHWSGKKRILKAYREASSHRIKEIRSASERLWELLVGGDFKRHRDYINWNSIRRTVFNRMWYVKRRHVLDSIKMKSQEGRDRDSRVFSFFDRMCGGSVINPGGVMLSRKTQAVLENGPKFCIDVKPSRVDVFSSIQSVARIVRHEERAAFIEQAVGRMENVMGIGYPNEKRDFRVVSSVRKELEDWSLQLLQTDKSGRFAVLSKSSFQTKTGEAMESLFQEWGGNIGKLKKNIVSILEEDEFKDVAKTMLNLSKSALSVKFFIKDHKPEMPLRVVINENGTWQKVVSVFLQKGLNHAILDKSLSLRNSSELITVLEGHHGKEGDMLSMDIKDLYYSLEKSRLLERVKSVLEMNLVRFQSRSGISVDSFLAVLDYYLQSTIVEYQGKTYLQKEGVCIGSSVAPALAEIYLNSLDCIVSDKLQELTSESCFVKRYVDDILICSFREGLSDTLEALIRSAAPELRFTVERPMNGKLQFLELMIHNEKGLCWEYRKENAKPLLSKNSCHSRTVKAGIVKSLITNAMDRSCTHFLAESVKRQWRRLNSAGYQDEFVGKQLSVKFADKCRGEPKQRPKHRTTVIPYYHKISHNLKACAKKFDVDLVFSSDYKLSKLTPFHKSVRECTKMHREKSIPCDNGMVYEIPLECGFKHVGQTSRCINDRLTEHKRNVKNNATDSEIAKHVQECNNCIPRWSETEIIHREVNDIKRVVKETIRMKSMGNCISQVSVQLSSSSKTFLRI
ncbi:uncharacterized protein LOC121834568 [Ixodes scapularis]|uniref:uncharacterized protein LOC121834568 n=1 Tax=Ixodes scapularis TaxID=6945 RepID=UPI001C384177|nr:uncharacterized protein LOC121834568 [Ixodes scapularis]